MSKLIVLIITAGTLFLQSCSSGNGPKAAADTAFVKSCYLSVDGKDTAVMTIKTFSKTIEGNLVFNFYKKDKNNGNIKGAFRGDTLFVDYGFQVGSKESWYKNPLVFLKKDGKLIMGIGKMQTTMGKTYFRKDVPIDFSMGRFTFEKTDCR